MPIYMQVPGAPGNVTHASFKNWIELYSFSWGTSNGASVAVGSAGNSVSLGVIENSGATFEKGMDSASVQFFQYVVKGTKLGQVRVVFTPNSASGSQPYMETIMSDCLLASHMTHGGGADNSTPHETCQIVFAKVEHKTMPTDEAYVSQQYVGSYNYATMS